MVEAGTCSSLVTGQSLSKNINGNNEDMETEAVYSLHVFLF